MPVKEMQSKDEKFCFYVKRKLLENDDKAMCREFQGNIALLFLLEKEQKKYKRRMYLGEPV